MATAPKRLAPASWHELHLIGWFPALGMPLCWSVGLLPRSLWILAALAFPLAFVLYAVALVFILATLVSLLRRTCAKVDAICAALLVAELAWLLLAERMGLSWP